MKISRFEIFEFKASQRGNWIFIRVSTKEGLTGLGEASQSGNNAIVRVALRECFQRIRGEDAAEVERLWTRMAGSTDVFSGVMGRAEATALSAFDQALWDIRGKMLGEPVWRLLGGRYRDRIRLYANLNRGTIDRSPRGFARAASKAVEAGFLAVKSTPFDEVHWSRSDRDDMEADLDRGIERLREVRNAIGPDIQLLVDCHARFDLPLARRVARALKPLDLFWLEEPISRDLPELLEPLRTNAEMALAGGEALFGRRAFWPLIVNRSLDVIMPDVKHAGGISETRRIASLAEVMQVAVAPHNPSGPVSTLASVHLCAAIPNFLILEFPFGEVPWRAAITQPNELIQNGHITVPDLPGIGIELDLDQVEAPIEREEID